jgi:peptidoglycan/xylan/chitin deacetylase (PgdA/CDA1 family)
LTLILSISIIFLSLSSSQADRRAALPENAGGIDHETGYATVFVYHKFNEPSSPSTSISSEILEAQLKYLKENAFHVVQLHEIVTYLKEGLKIPPRTVAITLDDGYKSVYEHAFPLLKKYDFAFTIFLYMEAIDSFSDYLTVDELREMKKYGKVTFGNHSFAHSRFARWPRDASQEDYLKSLEDDLLKSEKRFDELLGFKSEFYAFPYGEYNREFVELLRQRGYSAAFTQDPFNTGPATDRFLIPRNPIVGTWATMEKFKEFLETEPISVQTFYPDYGVLNVNPLPKIEFTAGDILPYENIGIYVSELGWLKPEVDRKEGRVKVLPLQKLKRKINRVGITARNTVTGRKASFFYMIILR